MFIFCSTMIPSSALVQVVTIGFFKWRTTVSGINNTVTIYSLVGLISLPGSIILSKRMGLAYPVVVCQLCSAGVVLILAFVCEDWEQGEFLPLFYLAQCFSMIAGMLSPIQQAMLFPNAERDKWNARQQAVQTVIRGAAGLIELS